MRVRMLADGRVLEGTPRQIVMAMQALSFGQDHRSLSEYMAWVVDQAQRLNDVVLKVSGESDEEQAASLVAAGLVERL